MTVLTVVTTQRFCGLQRHPLRKQGRYKGWHIGHLSPGHINAVFVHPLRLFGQVMGIRISSSKALRHSLKVGNR